jgi:hypothetical protein
MVHLDVVEAADLRRLLDGAAAAPERQAPAPPGGVLVGDADVDADLDGYRSPCPARINGVPVAGWVPCAADTDDPAHAFDVAEVGAARGWW